MKIPMLREFTSTDSSKIVICMTYEFHGFFCPQAFPEKNAGKDRYESRGSVEQNNGNSNGSFLHGSKVAKIKKRKAADASPHKIK